MVCTTVEHSCRPIKVDEIAQLLQHIILKTFFFGMLPFQHAFTSTWSYENRVNKHFVISLNFPCLIACLLSCLSLNHLSGYTYDIFLCVHLSVVYPTEIAGVA